MNLNENYYNFNKELIAWSINKDPKEVGVEESLRFKLVDALSAHGLLKSRLVRFILGVDFENLSVKVRDCLQADDKKPKEYKNALSNQFQELASRKWSVGSIEKNGKIKDLYEQIRSYDSVNDVNRWAKELRDRRPLNTKPNPVNDWLAEALKSPLPCFPEKAYLNLKGYDESVIETFLENWIKSKERKEGDYFVYSSSNSNKENPKLDFYKLCVWDGASRPKTFKITKQPDNIFQVHIDMNIISFTDREQLKGKLLKRGLHIDNPAPPSLAKQVNVNKMEIPPMHIGRPIQNRELTEPYRQLTEPLIANDDINSISEKSQDGERTIASKVFLQGVTEYKNGKLLYKREQYQPIQSSQSLFTGEPRYLVSAGSSVKREMLILDSESALLDRHYQALKNQIKPNQRNGAPIKMEEAMSILNNYVREEIFPSCEDEHLQTRVDDFIKKYKQQNPTNCVYHKEANGSEVAIPVISIDDFIENGGIGVCRHHALVASYLWSRLSEDGLIPEGVVQEMRANLLDSNGRPTGAHVWVAFTEKATGKKWHLDTLWNVKTQMEGERLKALKKVYGKKNIDNQMSLMDLARKKS